MSGPYVFADDVVSILPIAEILEYATVDASFLEYDCDCDDEDCRQCNGEIDVDKIVVGDLLDMKRDDDHYQDVLDSLAENGFLAPIGIHPTERKLTDGHHRLAAAIDLCYRYVPVRSQNGCSADSGEWWVGNDIPVDNLRLYGAA